MVGSSVDWDVEASAAVEVDGPTDDDGAAEVDWAVATCDARVCASLLVPKPDAEGEPSAVARYALLEAYPPEGFVTLFRFAKPWLTRSWMC